MTAADPDILRLPLEAVTQIRNRNLREQLELCARGHPFYREMFARERIDVASIRTIDDLVQLPITSKAEFARDPEAFRLRVPDLPPEERIIWEVIHTTGTVTGEPAMMYTTTFDHYAFLVAAARAGELNDIRPTDLIANLLPLASAPMGAFIRATHHASSVGAAIVNGHPGHWHPEFKVHRSVDELIDMIQRHRATVLLGVPGFVRRLLIRAGEVGADFSTVRVCAVTGEYCPPSMREDLKTRLRALGSPAPTVNDRYGTTEIGLLTQCAEGAPWHNPAPEFIFLEVLDEKTYERLPDGERGLLVMTHLRRRGTVMLRYVIGDVVSMSHDRCPICGRTAERVIGPPVRTKELVKVKGMLINPDIMKEEIGKVPGIAEYQFVFRKEDANDPNSMDQLVVRVALSGRAQDDARGEIERVIRRASNVTPVITFHDATAIYDPDRRSKPERVVDLRPRPEVPQAPEP
jgi:phenylacetate-CoA ligase